MDSSRQPAGSDLLAVAIARLAALERRFAALRSDSETLSAEITQHLAQLDRERRHARLVVEALLSGRDAERARGTSEGAC
jgi:uncharacterized coiled-coil protein SlyX